MPSTKPAAVALRHVAFEDLGLLSPILDAAGWIVSYRDAPTDDLSDSAIEAADLLIVLGGPIGVYEAEAYPFLNDEVALLQRRLTKDRPTLGICLGSQLMAKALGSRVFAGPVKEIGWGRVELTESGLASCLAPLAADGASVLHWHGDTFDLPPGAARLAGNAHYENQAFAFGMHAVAVQFHIEAAPRALENWFVAHAVELAAAGIPVRDLRSKTAAVAGMLRQQAQSVFAPWLRRIAQSEGNRSAARCTASLSKSEFVQ